MHKAITPHIHFDDISSYKLSSAVSLIRGNGRILLIKFLNFNHGAMVYEYVETLVLIVRDIIKN